MKKNLYHYNAHVLSVYDGDTIRVDIDLGMKTFIHNEKIRFNRINAPELKGKEREAGLKARDYLRSLILDKDILLGTVKDRKGKYGRYLAEVWLEENPDKFINVNDLLVKKGYAVYKEY